MFEKIMSNKDLKKYFWSGLLIFLGVILLFFLFSGKNKNINIFFSGIENKTFDLRQNITAKNRKHNKDIVILAIDNMTYEYVTEKYGDWPMPRYIYADVVNFIEKQNPKTVAFDLLFVNSVKDTYKSDLRLTEVFQKYDNVYTAMNFDDMKEELRHAGEIDKKFQVNLDNKLGAEIQNFTNFRPILSSITESTSNVGHIMTGRDENDGVLREYIPFVSYKGAVYPHMTLLIGQHLLNENSKDFVIDKDMKLKFGKQSFPITKDGTFLLNWYGEKETFEHISMAEVMNAAEQSKLGEKTKFDDYFKNKIVYIGTTVLSLSDIKTVPTEGHLAGVETHTTFLNNMLDNNFIHRVTFEWDFIITLALCLFIGFTMLKVESSKINYKYFVPINSAVLLTSLILYYLVSIFLMDKFNLWIAVVMPTVGMILTFTAIYVIKYFFKSKDYEYTYRLATTDGLTELYNHRFFQEKMIEKIEECKKSGKKFSLILTDIDFFKKFNDQYGHQAGDAVLRQVAKTLKKNVKRIDYVCRYGGEEMSVILVNADNKEATIIAQRLCDAISSQIFKLSSTQESHVTISLGVSTYPDNGSTPTELIEYSDRGLYAAKENGRNQVGVIKNL